MSEKLNSKSSVQKHDGYEKSDAEVKVVIKFLAGLAVLLVVVMLMMSGFYDFLEYTFGRTDAEVSPLVDVAQIPPEPRLQANPAEDLVLIRGWE